VEAIVEGTGCGAMLRRLWAAMCGVVVVLSLGSAASASAELPTHVARNKRAIAEYQFKRLSPAVSGDEPYPACHRACLHLWKAERQLDPASSGAQELWRELYVLGYRLQLQRGWPDYRNLSPPSLAATPVSEESIFGEEPWRADSPPQRHVGVVLPAAPDGATGGGSLVMPHTVVDSGGVNDIRLRAPTLGWFVEAHPEDLGPGCPQTAVPTPRPGPSFIKLSGAATCWTWVGNDLAEISGYWEVAWFSAATFDGPPSLAPGSYDDTSQHYQTMVDPGFASIETTLPIQLENNDDDYAQLISWLDLQLGGDGDFTPQPAQFYGSSNPGARNLTHACAGDPVDCATGNFSQTYRDTNVAGPGVTLSQARTYNSQAAVDQAAPGPFGYGWSASFRDYLEIAPGSGNVTVHQDNGSQVRFDRDDEDGSYSADAFVQATLTKHLNGTFTYVLPSLLTLTFGGDGQLVSEVDHAGNTTTLSYTGDDLTTVTDAVGRTMTFTYNNDGTVEAATDPGGHTLHYGYVDGNLTSVEDVAGNTTDFAYDTSHQLTDVTDARGHVVVTNDYDGQHRVASQTDAQSHETTWDYGTGTTTITGPDGSVTEETFKNNLLTQMIRAKNTPSQATTSYSYDEDFNLVRTLDPDGHEWKAVYDTRGNRTEVTDPRSRATSYEYDSAHRVTRITQPSGVYTQFQHNTSGLLASATEYNAAHQQIKHLNYQYTLHGLVSYAWNNDTHYWSYAYDSNGNQTALTTPANRTSHATYDANGFAISNTTPMGNTTVTSRNAYELPTSVTDPRGKSTVYAYDGDGNRTSVTDRNGHETTTSYDANNRPIADHRPDGTTWSTSYTSTGQVASRTDGRGKTTSYTYDHQQRPHTVTDPLDRVTTFGYDAAGNRTSIEDPGGHLTTQAYDAANQLTTIDYSSPATDDVSFTYDDSGLRATMVDGTGTTTYTHDDLGHLTSQTTGAGQVTTYHYDDWDHVTAIDYPDALTAVTVGSGTGPTHVTTGTVHRTYDADGELTSVADWLSNTTTFTYNNDGELTDVTRPNGVNASYTYANDGSLITLTDNAATATVGRDDERRVTSTTAPVDTYSYDAANRLTSDASRSYGYDDADNLTVTATPAGAATEQHFDDANQLTARTQGATTVATFDYDDEGRRTNETEASATTDLGWSQADDLLSYDGPDRSGAASTTSEQYGYDGDGLRQTKTSDSQRTHQAYDISSDLPLMIEDGPTAYITGPDGLPLEQIDAAGTALWFHHDQLGSTTTLTSTTGATVQSYAYDPYGQRTSAAPTVENPFQFAGQYTDAKTGLQDLRARYYDPATGQFLSRDPLEDTTLHPYAYADNDPTNATDPSGLSVLSTVSDAAAGTLDGLTGGYSTKLAASLLDFNLDCAHFGAGFSALRTAAFVGSLADGEGELALVARLGIKETQAAKGARAGEDAFSHGLKYHPRIRARGVEDPLAHNFPYSFDDVVLKETPTLQKDGSLLYRKVGSINGKDGVYEIGVNQETGTIFHRTWRSR
jgi:RHS repeat-associated protein